jgi:hypothetical protein
MLPPLSSFDPSRRELKADIQKRLRIYGVTDRVFGVVQTAYQDALVETGVVLSRQESNRLLRDVLKEVLGQMIQEL